MFDSPASVVPQLSVVLITALTSSKWLISVEIVLSSVARLAVIQDPLILCTM